MSKVVSGNRITKRIIRSFVVSTMGPFLLIMFLPIIVFSSVYRNDISKLSLNYLDSISDRFYGYLSNFDQMSLLVYYDDDLMHFLTKQVQLDTQGENSLYQKSQVMEELFGKMQNTKDGIVGLLLVGESGSYYASNHSKLGRVKDDYDWKGEEWYQAALNGNGALVVIPHYQPKYLVNAQSTEIISLVRVIRDIITKKPLAVIKMDILYDDFAEMFGSNFNIPTKLILSNNSSGKIIFETENVRIDSWLEQRDSIEKTNSLVDQNALLSRFEKDLGKYNCTLTALLDFSLLKSQFQLIILIEIGLYILTFLIALYINIRGNRNIVYPIKAIKKVLKQAAIGNFSVRYNGNPEWELQELGNEINSMIEQLGLTLEKNRIIQKKNQEIEFKVLFSQIQPHFIFNILNSFINQLCHEKYDLLEEGLYALSNLLRYVLKDEAYTTIEQEMVFINSYCILQRERFSNRLDFKISVDEDCKNILIPRLILQPFVENSILHGIEPSSHFCLLEVKVRKECDASKQEEIEILIQDDGVGFCTDITDFNKSIGVKNCKERIMLIYPFSSIDISSTIQGGTTVRIRFRSSGNEDYYS